MVCVWKISAVVEIVKHKIRKLLECICPAAYIWPEYIDNPWWTVASQLFTMDVEYRLPSGLYKVNSGIPSSSFPKPLDYGEGIVF
jgi:hypothetical protein